MGGFQDEEEPAVKPEVPGSTADDYLPADAPEDDYVPAKPPRPPTLGTDVSDVESNINRIAAYGETVERFDAVEAARAARHAENKRRRAHNAEARKISEETGAQFRTDEKGDYQPVIDPETKKQKFTPRTTPVRYDDKGRPYQVKTDETGGRTVEDPDAKAEYGENPDDPNDKLIYRKTKATPWQPIDPEEGIKSADPALVRASAKFLHGRELKAIDNRENEIKLARGNPKRLVTKVLTPEKRQELATLIETNSKPAERPMPKKSFFGMMNQEATAKAEAEWLASERGEFDPKTGALISEGRVQVLAKAQALLQEDDELTALEQETYDLALKKDELTKGGPAAYLGRRRKEQAAAFSSLPPEQAKAELANREATLGQQDREIAEKDADLTKRAEALRVESEGATPTRAAEIERERAAIIADAKVLQETVAGRNALAEDTNAGLAEREENRKKEAREARNELRTKSPEIADEMDDIDAEYAPRLAEAQKADEKTRDAQLEVIGKEKQERIDKFSEKLGAKVTGAIEKHGHRTGFKSQIDAIEKDESLTPFVRKAAADAIRENAVDAIIRSENFRAVGGKRDSAGNYPGWLDKENPADREKAKALLEKDPGLAAKARDGFDHIATTFTSRVTGALTTWMKGFGETYNIPGVKQIGAGGYKLKTDSEALREKNRDPRLEGDNWVNRFVMPAVAEALPNIAGALTGPLNLAWNAAQLYDEGYSQADKDPNLSEEQKRTAASVYTVLGYGPELVGDYATLGFINTRSIRKAAKLDVITNAASFLRKSKGWDALPAVVKRGVGLIAGGTTEGVTEVIQDKILAATIETIKTGDVAKSIQKAAADNTQALDTFVIAALSGGGQKFLDTVASTATAKGDKTTVAAAEKLRQINQAFPADSIAERAADAGVDFDAEAFAKLESQSAALSSRMGNINAGDALVRIENASHILEIEKQKAGIIANVLAGMSNSKAPASSIRPEQIAAANVEIDDWQPQAGLTPEGAQTERLAARGALKLIAGQPEESLLAAERAALGQKLPDKSPRMEVVNGTPVITDGQLRRLKQVAPGTEALPIRDESTLRSELTGPSDEEIEQTPAVEGGPGVPTSDSSVSPETSAEAGTETPAPAAAEVAPSTLPPLSVGKAGAIVTPVEKNAARSVAERLVASGAAKPAVAKAFSEYFVRREGTNEWSEQSITGAVQEFERAGGRTKPADIIRAIRATATSQMPQIEAIHRKVVSDLGKAYGKLPEAKRKQLDNIIRHRIAPELITYVGAVQTIVAGTKALNGAGMGIGVGNTFNFNLPDLLQTANLENLMDDVAIERTINEEIGHIANITALSAQRTARNGEKGEAFDLARAEAAEIFSELPKEVQEYVRGIRETPNLKEPDDLLGMEFFRMLLQRDLAVQNGVIVTADGRVLTEQTLSTGTVARLKKLFASIIRVFDALKENLTRSLAAEGRPQAEIDRLVGRIESARAESLEIFRNFKKTGDAARSQSYREAYAGPTPTASTGSDGATGANSLPVVAGSGRPDGSVPPSGGGRTEPGTGAGVPSGSPSSSPAPAAGTVDEAAAAAEPEPTEAQKEAGNYRMGHIRISGLDISIENSEGSVRRGRDGNGKPWEITMSAHYGYIRETEAVDGDHLDVFIKPGTPTDWTGPVWVVNQVRPNGDFDEHKAVIGAETLDEARALYSAHYAADWKGLGSIVEMPFDEFKEWAMEGDLTKPVEVSLRGKQAVAAKLPVDQLGEYIRGEHSLLPPSARPLSDADLNALFERFQSEGDEARMDVVRREFESRAYAESSTGTEEAEAEGAYELIDTIKRLGGFPVTDDVLGGEIAIVRESNKARQRGLFKPTADSLDVLRSNLADYGFAFETPAELVEALQLRLQTDRPMYGNRISDENQVFARGDANSQKTADDRSRETYQVGDEEGTQSENGQEAGQAEDRQPAGLRADGTRGRSQGEKGRSGDADQALLISARRPDSPSRRLARNILEKSADAAEIVAGYKAKQNIAADVAEKIAAVGKLDASNGVQLQARAFHGTPHKIDGEFSLDKIGTGEGAQVYGWGLYFAENEAVATQYRRNLSYKETRAQFLQDLPEDADFDDVTGLLGTGSFTPYQERVIRELAVNDWLGFDYPSQAISAAYRNLEDFDPSPELRDAVEGSGNLYEVELDAESDDLLDWDKPLSLQSQKFRSSFGYMRKKLADHIESRRKADAKDMERRGLQPAEYESLESKSGAGWYGNLADYLGSPQRASDYLRDIGIPGIRFLDGGSRGKFYVNYQNGNSFPFPTRDLADAEAKRSGGTVEETHDREQTSNYVIFDASKIRIVSENGLAVSAADVEPQLQARARNPDQTGDLFEFAATKSEGVEYREALETEGITSFDAQKEAAQEDFGITDIQADALFAPAIEPPPSIPGRIGDFGEKIGGARKDISTKTGPTGKKPVDDRPGWARRYQISQIAKGSRAVDEGRFVISDLKNLDWRKQPRRVGENTFATEEEAKAAIPLIAVSRNHSVRMEKVPGTAADAQDYQYTIWRKVSDNKHVQVVEQSFPTREDALRHMAQNAESIIETKTSWREELIVKPEQAVRTGKVRRDGPATPEMFQSTFGFRGVEFGNWMRQAGDGKERQDVLNHAFDGLLDLADVLGIPPRAISLNGELALAFGARGQGLLGAKAHYERDYAVINLTKMSGAGSLAHEWFHGFDHYLARLDGKAAREMVQNPEGDRVFPAKDRGTDYVSHGFGHKSLVRQPVREAYNKVVETIFKKAVQYVEDSEKAERFVKAMRKNMEDELQSIRKNLSEQLDTTYYRRNNKPATEEQLAEFDRLSNRLLDGEDLETEYRYSKPGDTPLTTRGAMAGRWTNDTLDALSVIYKSVRGRSGFSSEQNGIFDHVRAYLKNYAQRIAMLESAAKSETKSKMVPTEFAMNAKRIDQGSATDYWTTPHEMAARAFSAYVEDRIGDQGATSDFLSYGSDNKFYRMLGLRPFPEGSERVAIGASFDTLFRTLEAVETEAGTQLQSRGNYQARKATTIAEAFSAASEFLGKPITNADDGLEASVSANSLRKILSASSSRKSDSMNVHLSASANADHLFENAIRIATHEDRSGDLNIVGVHRYLAPMVSDGEIYAVKLTVKEFRTSNQGNRIYSIEALGLEKVKPTGQLVPDSLITEVVPNTPIVGSIEKIRAKFAAVNSQQREQLQARASDSSQEIFNFDDIPVDAPAAIEDGDKSPLDRFKAEIPQAMRIAGSFDNIPGVDMDEVRQNARLALADAARNFDPARGRPFTAYAGVSVRNRLRDLYKRESIRRERFPVSLSEPVGEGETDTRGDFAPDETTPSAAASAIQEDGRSILAAAISDLPEKMQTAVRGFYDHKTLEEIGRELGGVSKQRAGKLLEAAFRTMRGKLGERGVSRIDQILARPSDSDGDGSLIDALLADLDAEIPGYQEAALAEEAAGGRKTIGRPDLAFGAENADIRGLDQYYTDKFLPESEAQWENEARAMLEKDYAGTWRAIQAAGLAGQVLTPAQTKAADLIARDLRRKMMADGTAESRKAFNVFWYAYRSTGTAAGRALASRHDPFKTPAERHREFLMELISKPRKAAQKEIDAAPTQGEKDREIADLTKQLTQAKEQLDAAEVRRIEAELTAQRAAPTKEYLIDKETADLLAKLKAAGITPQDILGDKVALTLVDRNIINAFEQVLSRGADSTARRRAFRAILANKDFADIAKSTGLPEAEVRQIKADFVKAMRDQHFAKFMAGAKADAPSLITGKTVPSDEAEKEFAKWLKKLGIVDDAQQGKAKFRVDDPAHVIRMARAIQAARGDHTKADMLYEWWIMGILSGPATHSANITGNLVSGGLDMTLQRGIEAIINLGVQDVKAARMGEFKYLLAGIKPGVAKGFAMAAKAWSAEHDFFESTILGTPLELDQQDKLGGTKAAIPGTAGRIIRIPGRALLFMDSLFKTALGQMEAGAQAYRMARAAGFSGDKLAKRVALLSKTRGEILSEYLPKAKPGKEVAEFFARQLARRDDTLDVDDLVSDPASIAWEMAREQTAYDMAKAAGWTDAAWQAAVEKARELTFQQDLQTTADGGNAVEDVAAKIQDARYGNKLIGFFFPFVRTPYNIFRTGIRKSPLGILNLGVQLSKGLYSIKDGRPYLEAHPTLVRDLAEQTIAFAAFALLWGAAQGDGDDDDKFLLITGSMPVKETSRGERALNVRAYGGDYVIRIGGRNGLYMQYGRIEPIATVLGSTIDILRGIKAQGTTRENMIRVWNYMVASANTKSFLQGFATLTEMAEGRSDPIGTAKRMGLQAIVPNIIRQPLRNLDDHVRDAKLAGMEYTLLPTGSLAEPKIDVYGREILKAGNPIARIFVNSPLAADETLLSADKFLLNWNRQNPSESWAPDDAATTYRNKRKETVQMTAEEARVFRIRSGQVVARKLKAIVTPLAVARPTLQVRNQIRDAFSEAREETRNRMFGAR